MHSGVQRNSKQSYERKPPSMLRLKAKQTVARPQTSDLANLDSEGTNANDTVSRENASDAWHKQTEPDVDLSSGQLETPYLHKLLNLACNVLHRKPRLVRTSALWQLSLSCLISSSSCCGDTIYPCVPEGFCF